MRTRSTRTELTAVALALLLPIPLFVASGLRLPLPGAVERALASLGSDAVFGPAEVEARPRDARSDRGTPDSAVGSASTDRRRATSSTALVVVGMSSAPSAGDGADQPPAGGSIPDAGDDGTPPPGDTPESDPIPDVPTPPREAPSAPIEVEAATPVETGTAPVEVKVTDEGVEVDVVGHSIDVPVPDVPVPNVPAPAPPVPLPPLSLP